MKQCKKCLQWKSTIEFNKCTRNTDGLYHWCRTCRNSERKKGDWNYSHSEKGIKARNKYRHSEKGKELCRKASARCYARRKRDMDWELLFPNPLAYEEEIDYHHITRSYVVAIPRDLHRLFYGDNHKENLMYIVGQIYLGGEIK